ncbi:hypothetical protein SDRG_06266 [Saprolegnia diclina VS20]|uniref:Uncharacterized protein n=1 Tax=Saprolegnia diclina (strain VS20) TaxID=1156394 RepID=T0QQH8_SAPDV|nr:hypothetical protein SDRG_06266 [Saprolegnia diclina VS20]EQC36150.1 hypothetical protein SDRG_06266 [Saprolegnia diclina VS20]|eukprot:XP_008610256.1 hypothetical protein SDRG_06266 [Saprolegnia diclina VS20]
MLYNSQYIQDKEAKRRAREEQLFRETYPALYATEQRRKAKEARTAAKLVSSPKPQPKKTPVVRPATKLVAKATKPVVDHRKKAAAAATTTPVPVRSTAPVPKAATPLEIAQARITELTTKLAVAQRTIDEQHATIARLQQATEPTTKTLDDATDSIPSTSMTLAPTLVADSAAAQADTDAQSSESKSPMALMQQAILQQAPSLHRIPRTGNFLHAPPLLWTPDERVAAIDTLVRAITAIETGQPMVHEPYLVLAPCPPGRRDVALE